MKEGLSKDALKIYQAALNSVSPKLLMPKHLQKDERYLYIGREKIKRNSINKLLVIAVGKAAAAMAQMAELIFGDVISGGICITKYEHALPLSKMAIMESAHPIPDEMSIEAGRKVKVLLENVTEQDIVIVLLSGGASALMEDLPEGIRLSDLQVIISKLLHSGADIHELNTIRKQLSNLKGGGLAQAAFPAQLHTLILSDVVGDDIGIIASGPTVPDTSCAADAISIFLKYNFWHLIPDYIQVYLMSASNQQKIINDSWFKNSFSTIIGSNSIALAAAEKQANLFSYPTVIYKKNTTGDTIELAHEIINYCRKYDSQLPVCFLIGGETTLAVSGNGKGGRNQHFVLSALAELFKVGKQSPDFDIVILCAGTDGTDGATDAAGAIADWSKVKEMENIEHDINKALANFDSYRFFETFGGLIKTGPSQTNVMDIVVVILNAK